MVLFLNTEGAGGDVDMVARNLIDGIVFPALLKRRSHAE